MEYIAETECYRENHCRVLTPDGGQICCSTPAEAARVAEDMDRLRTVNAELLAALRRGCESLEDAIRTTDEQVPAGWTKYNRESLDMMRAAIARAEGETKNPAV